MAAFQFKDFSCLQNETVHKFGTDAMVLGAFATKSRVLPTNILDVGTGIGVLALMLAQGFPTAKIIGIDVNSAAVELASINFENAPFASRLTSVQQDFLTYFPKEKFDLIISNPPFYNTKNPPKEKEKSLSKHEKNMPISELTKHALTLLAKQGELWLILPSERTEELLKQEEIKKHLVQQISVYGKPTLHLRDILVFSTDNTQKYASSNFLIRNSSGNYTQEYLQLTENFHSKKKINP